MSLSLFCRSFKLNIQKKKKSFLIINIQKSLATQCMQFQKMNASFITNLILNKFVNCQLTSIAIPLLSEWNTKLFRRNCDGICDKKQKTTAV